ncbi:hypothetical protein UNSWDHB_2257 [Dehalobacter sp. UNSWDHB]|nr:hypothetical protein [Dehalobacter sp. UNSWDHB]EQB20429.1 hypothetical protein UNSWDHB_2257 [Dehalobacter sp. UNSWDHB]
MKQTAEKKPKVFRTLIRQVHTGNKKILKDNIVQAAEKERKNQPLFFFGL